MLDQNFNELFPLHSRCAHKCRLIRLLVELIDVAFVSEQNLQLGDIAFACHLEEASGHVFDFAWFVPFINLKQNVSCQIFVAFSKSICFYNE
jgi:hypothetical protein